MLLNKYINHQFFVLLVLLFSVLENKAQDTKFYSDNMPIKTGYNYSGDSAFWKNSSDQDPYWTLLYVEGNNIKYPIVKNEADYAYGWINDIEEDAKWISSGGTSVGTYYYRLNICIGDLQTALPKLVGSYACDNQLRAIKLDGQTIVNLPYSSTTCSGGIDYGFKCKRTLNDLIPVSALTPGSHVLEFEVYNIGAVTGLFLDLTFEGVMGYILPTSYNNSIAACAAKGQIRGVVFDDENTCNLRDNDPLDPQHNDALLSGREVQLYDGNNNFIKSTITDQFGTYNFYGLDISKDYVVKLEPALMQSFPVNGFNIPIGHQISSSSFSSAFLNLISGLDLGVFIEGNECEENTDCRDYADSDIGVPLRHGRVAVTKRPHIGAGGLDELSVILIDVRDPQINHTDATGTSNWNASKTGELAWNAANLGHVFGICTDKQVKPNIYVTATSSYSGTVFGAGGSGAVYKLDGKTGAVTTFAQLPTSVTNPSLGNICFDQENNQFFVSNLEDGRIYRINASGSIVGIFDPFAQDNGSVGMAPLGERVWGLGVYEGRLYFSLWAENKGSGSLETSSRQNAIYSMGIRSSGKLNRVQRLEVAIVDNVGGYSNPISDISFSNTGQMLLVERTMNSATETGSGSARAFRYEYSGASWVLAEIVPVGSPGSHENAAGGGAIGADGSIWVSGTDLYPGGGESYFGIQWLEEDYTNWPVGAANGAALPGVRIVDADNAVSQEDNWEMGDVELYLNTAPCAAQGRILYTTECLDDVTNQASVTIEIKDVSPTAEVNWSIDGIQVSGTIVNHTFTGEGPFTIVAHVTDLCDCGYVLRKVIDLHPCKECVECIPSFQPIPGEKYTLSAWVKEDIQGTPTYEDAVITLEFRDAGSIGPIYASGAIIDGWQRIEYTFVLPLAATDISVRLQNLGSNKVFFDDVRIHPFNSNMKSFVYDPITLRLFAELDENNYATLYEYDEEGALVRVKKETERGIKTINETRQNLSKQPK